MQESTDSSAAPRTTGSRDFKQFVTAALADHEWNLSNELDKGGFGLSRLKMLSGFLLQACTLAQPSFGPSKQDLLLLYTRLLGVDDFSGTKVELWNKLGTEVDALLADWPPRIPVLGDQDVQDQRSGNTSPGLDDQAAQFWASLADSLTPNTNSNNTDFYPSVLLNLGAFRGSTQELIDKLALEAAALNQLVGQNLLDARPSIARTFATISNVPMPASLPVDVLKKGAIAFIVDKIKALRDGQVGRTPRVPQPVRPGHTRQPDQPRLSTTALPRPPTHQPAAESTLNRLAHNFDSLVDHLQLSGVADISMTSAVPPPLPAYIQRAIARPDSTTHVVQDTITDLDAREDGEILKRLQFIQSPLNIEQRIVHEDIERFIQKRFCSADMDILRLENKGRASVRNDIIRQKSLIYQDVRRVLEIRQQRHFLQKRRLGDVIAKAEIEDLKTREFRTFATIRLKLRALFASPADRKAAYASVTSKEDCALVQAALFASPAASQSVLTMLHKSRFARKRSPIKPLGTSTSPIRITKKRKRTGICYQCGATGADYHPFSLCPEWKKGAAPKKGSVFAKQKAQGMRLPTKKP